MTKRRPPLTFFAALVRAVELLGYDGIAQILGCSESLVRKLSDPDTEREISLRNARRIDEAYQRAGGDGAPFLECYALQLELAGSDLRPSQADLLAAVGAAAKETGEAVAFALKAIENEGCDLSRAQALREIEEGIASLTGIAAKLGGAGMMEKRG
ncbi:hypothetical protein [Sphingobium lignivorans]|uniref:AraC-like DNA-binding protein n=1 Tax=Sphingobium lignivorans TaxID=2735886 RepID=A0ABR6NDH3_9SPHN|nr:hypothetical protein [Sphingobium lignivorans]MBB5985332.1 AraC-like DNA-binding protein [Sphingobium lignivorans]